jgi:hypothetical protein
MAQVQEQTQAQAQVQVQIAQQAELKILLHEFEENLKLCKEVEKTRTPCKYGIECVGVTTKHFIDYTHPAEHHFQDADIEKYLECTYEFLIASRKIYDSNGRKLHMDWYNIIQKYLKESDYTRHDSLYFYLLSNIACNFKYIKKRFGKRFITVVLIGMEEHAVTGMFKVKKNSTVKKCLYNLGVGKEPNGTYYLSNTALLSFSDD